MSPAHCGFPPQHRLQSRRQFRTVLDNGVAKANSTTVVYARPSTAMQHRLGIIVARRVGSAVTRNRIKRIVREQFRHQRPKLTAAQMFDFVVIAKRRAADQQHRVARDVLHTLQALVNKMARS